MAKHSLAGRFVLAICAALSLAGCLKSKGPLLSPESASTPLPAGRYYMVSHLNAGQALPDVGGPIRVLARGNGYIAMSPDPDDRKPLHFHLIKVPDAGSIYLLQTDDDTAGQRDILIGVVGRDGFCAKDIREFPADAVTHDEVVSKPVLLRWLSEQAAAIAALANDVCYIRKK